MGKKVKSVVKKATNAVKNFTPYGAANYAIKKATGTDIIGGAGDALGNLLGGSGGSAGPQVNMGTYTAEEAVNQRTQAARDASQGLIKQLQDQATGKGPSLAGAQLKAAQDRNLSQLLAASAAQRGGNPALRQRMALQAQGSMGRETAQQSALARMQEQQLAQEQLGRQAIDQQRQDLSQIMEPAVLKSKGEELRFNADLARRNRVKNQQEALLGNLTDVAGKATLSFLSDENQKMAPQDSSKSRRQRMLEALNEDMRENAQNQLNEANKGGLAKSPADAIKNIGNQALAMGLFERAKKETTPAPSGAYNMRPMADIDSSDKQNKNPPESKRDFPKANKKLADMLDKLQPYEYEYKDTSLPGTSEGRNIGIMAQDLEKSEAGRELVKNTPDGKVIDTKKTFSAMLAAQADLNKRLKAVEGKKSKLAEKLKKA